MNIQIAGVPLKTSEGAYASEEPWSLSLIQFLLNPPQTYYRLI